jgi:hypothetical protein
MFRVRLILSLLLSLALPLMARAQGDSDAQWSAPRSETVLKLNAAYAVAGVINPQVEFRLSPHSSFQTEVVYSPWQSISGHPFHFGIFLNEYRYYISPKTKGLYVGANGGMMGFKMSKPMLVKGDIVFQNRYCKGFGFMFGAVVGYEWRFARRWMLDAFVGFSFMHSYYNGYSMDGEIDMYPHRPEDRQPLHPDPFNMSAEWLPNKAGISIGFILFDRQK